MMSGLPAQSWGATSLYATNEQARARPMNHCPGSGISSEVVEKSSEVVETLGSAKRRRW